MSTPTTKKSNWRSGSGENSPTPGNLTFVAKSDVEHAFSLILSNRMQDAREDLARWLASKVGEGGKFVIAEDRPRFLFRKAGCVWRVIFAGGPEFYIRDLEGAKYLDWFFRNPNEKIHALDLERLIAPGKANARARDSVQITLDPTALQDCRKTIAELNADLHRAQANGDTALCNELESELEEIREQLKKCRQMGDAGGRARDNVRKAIAKVNTLIRTSYWCEYAQAEGNIWE